MNTKNSSEDEKHIDTIVLDAGPLITNSPSISTLLSSAQRLITLPGVLAEVRDEAARARLETTVKPFLHLREPKPSSVKFVVDFARRTGDLAVLSKVDLSVLALTYEIECEKNGGDWRLRRSPGQKELNGPAPEKGQSAKSKSLDQGPNANVSAKVRPAIDDESTVGLPEESASVKGVIAQVHGVVASAQHEAQKPSSDPREPLTISVKELAQTTAAMQVSSEEQAQLSRTDTTTPPSPSHDRPIVTSGDHEVFDHSGDESTASTSDSEGWITPANLQKHQYNAINRKSPRNSHQSPPATLQAALITMDNALQNVALQINLNVLSPSASLPRIRHLRTYTLRCHACFQTTKEMSRQFCPRCGKPSLTRVACSTDAATGECKLHFKRNMQWNTRGDRYSIPKPMAGTSNGKVGSNNHGGGKGGWGHGLILAEDQKEYARAVGGAGRGKWKKERDLMSEDALPGILTGVRAGGSGRVNVGAGRNVNARKRR